MDKIENLMTCNAIRARAFPCGPAAAMARFILVWISGRFAPRKLLPCRGAHVISNSYGGGESGSQTYEGAYNHPGVAITVSSGGSGCGVQFPAASRRR